MPPGTRAVAVQPSRPPADAGFALPATIMTLTLLSLLAAGGLLMAWTELLSARAFRHSGRAHGLAEAGLATAIARARGPSPSIGPIGFGSDTVRVSFTQIGLLSKSERLFEVRSEATVAVGADRFVRTVAEVLWIADPLSVPAALSAQGNVAGSAASGSVSGLSATPTCLSPHASPVAGIAARPADSVNVGSLTVTGSPAETDLSDALARVAGLRWERLVGGRGARPDATWPDEPWPDSDSSGPVFVIVPAPDTLTSSESGYGVIAGAADLTLGHGFTWDGLVLAGQTLHLLGNATVSGAVMAGLGGGAALAADLGTGQVSFSFDPCAVARSAERIAEPPAPVPGTWREVW